jgi:hypothetical protein
VSTAPAVLSYTVIPESIAVSALITSSLTTTNPEHDDELLGSSSDSDFDPDTSARVSTTKLGLQRFDGLDTYVPGTVPERLYKRAQLAHDNFEEGFLLNIDDFAPTASEVAAIEAEVGDTALTEAIDSIKKTVRSGRHVRPSEKVKLNTEQALVFR